MEIELTDPTRYLGEVVTAQFGQDRVRDQRRQLKAQQDLNELLNDIVDKLSRRDVPALTAPERFRIMERIEKNRAAWSEALNPRGPHVD